MKVVKVFALLSLILLVNCEIEDTNKNLVASAINAILRRYFIARESKIDLVYYGTKGGLSESIAEAILRGKSPDIPVKVKKIATEKSKADHQRISSIHIFDSKQNYLNSFGRINWLSHKARRYEQLFFVPNLTSNDIVKYFSRFGFDLVNINFLIFHNSNSIELVASFMFTSDDCAILQPRVINEFRKKTKRWDNSNFFPEHFQNLHGCLVDFDFEYDYDAFIKSVHPAITKQINASVCKKENHDEKKSLTTVDCSNDNFTITKIKSDSFDIGWSEYFSSSGSVPVHFESVTFVVPQGEPYTQFEKMFMMFETEVWIAIGATFAITLTIIQIINLMPSFVQNFVYGRNIRTPTLNFFNIFLTGGQNRIPGRNFARFILILFLVWSLVIRTCYQSKLFEFLQMDLRKPRLETMDELIENNYTLYHVSLHDEMYVTEDMLSRFKYKREFASDDDLLYALSGAHQGKATALVGKEFFDKMLKYFKKIDNSTLKLYPIRESLRSTPRSISFGVYSPFFERFNELIGRMISGGIILHELSEQDWSAASESNLQVLTMSHLGVGLLIILTLLCLSIVVFLLEHIVHRLQNRSSTNRVDPLIAVRNV